MASLLLGGSALVYSKVKETRQKHKAKRAEARLAALIDTPAKDAERPAAVAEGNNGRRSGEGFDTKRRSVDFNEEPEDVQIAAEKQKRSKEKRVT